MKQNEKIEADQDVKAMKAMKAVMEENFFYLQQIVEKIAHRIEVEHEVEEEGYDKIVANLAEALEHIGRLALSYKHELPL